MLLGQTKLLSHYKRKRNNKLHTVSTTRTLYHLQCDSCGAEFYRTAKQFNKRSGTHVCVDCDQKSFAQSQSSMWRRVGKFDASSSFKL
jgi:predicted SprT family Zn-dependent metalloprotease